MISQHLPSKNVWSIKFTLNEYMPSEVEQMTGLTTDSQRDWRRRGFLPKLKKHARYTIFDAAELYIMRILVDQGKSPGTAGAYASKIAASMMKTTMMWRRDVWAGDPVAAFDALPQGSRRSTVAERPLRNDGTSPKTVDVLEHQKLEWLVDTLLRALGMPDVAPWGGQAIWWPNGTVELASYNDERWRIDEGILDRVDPKFDGAASVIHLEGAGANLVRRSRTPLIEVAWTVDPGATPNRPDLDADHGSVVIETRRIKP